MSISTRNELLKKTGIKELVIQTNFTPVIKKPIIVLNPNIEYFIHGNKTDVI